MSVGRVTLLGSADSARIRFTFVSFHAPKTLCVICAASKELDETVFIDAGILKEKF